jgi:phosphoadenosine phosphosulfate reductase
VVSAIESAMSELQKARSRSSKALVAYSDGKDSRAVLDMALRHFDHVEGFYMWFVPDLQFMTEGLAAAEHRWGIKIHQFPHWSALLHLLHSRWSNG